MERNISFILNNEEINVKINPSFPLLDFIRKNQYLTGTKEVCKEGDCGACSVLLGILENEQVNYKTINSCIYPIYNVNGKHVVTIEGLNHSELTPIQNLFVDEGASQCGFCTPGFIVGMTGYLLNSTNYNEDEAINSIAGNICRCTGYQSIKRSISKLLLALDSRNLSDNNKLEYLYSLNILPNYFNNIAERLRKLDNALISEVSNVRGKQIISGGTDLFVQRPDELLKTHTIFTNEIIEQKPKIVGNEIILPGNININDFFEFISNSNIGIEFNKLKKLFASHPIRNSATLAGNIVNASPIADLAITFIALNAKVKIKSNNNERYVSLDNFYKDYKQTDLKTFEFIEEIIIPIPNKSSFFNFEKVSKRTYLDIASVNTAILIETIDDKILNARISAGGVAPIPSYLQLTSDFLKNKKISNDLIISLTNQIEKEISPISDVRGSKEYKTILLKQLIKAHFIELFPEVISHEVLK